MKALVYTGPHQMEMREIDDPKPAADDEVLLKVEACGICGSDMHAWHGHDDRRPAPLVLGHEAVGIIMGGPNDGTRVVVNPLVTCQACEDCKEGRENLCAKRQIISMPPREGAFAQYLVMPERNLVRVPDGVATRAAALTEPLACGWHAVRIACRASVKPLDDCSCMVLGGGAIGFGASLALAANGAREIWIGETNPVRRKILEQSGSLLVFDPSAEGGPRPSTIDIVIDGVGIDVTRAKASASVRPGGVIGHIGLGAGNGGLDIRRLTLQEITFFGTYTYTMQDFRDTAAAIFEGRLGALDWADVRPLESGAQAFTEIDEGRAAAPKIILEP